MRYNLRMTKPGRRKANLAAESKRKKNRSTVAGGALAGGATGGGLASTLGGAGLAIGGTALAISPVVVIAAGALIGAGLFGGLAWGATKAIESRTARATEDEDVA